MGLVENLYARVHQLGADRDRHRRADDAAMIANTRYIVPMSLWLVE